MVVNWSDVLHNRRCVVHDRGCVMDDRSSDVMDRGHVDGWGALAHDGVESVNGIGGVVHGTH